MCLLRKIRRFTASSRHRWQRHRARLSRRGALHARLADAGGVQERALWLMFGVNSLLTGLQRPAAEALRCTSGRDKQFVLPKELRSFAESLRPRPESMRFRIFPSLSCSGTPYPCWGMGL